jgi:hypothetical protein
MQPILSPPVAGGDEWGGLELRIADFGLRNGGMGVPPAFKSETSIFIKNKGKKI